MMIFQDKFVKVSTISAIHNLRKAAYIETYMSLWEDAIQCRWSLYKLLKIESFKHLKICLNLHEFQTSSTSNEQAVVKGARMGPFRSQSIFLSKQI